MTHKYYKNNYTPLPLDLSPRLHDMFSPMFNLLDKPGRGCEFDTRLGCMELTEDADDDEFEDDDLGYDFFSNNRLRSISSVWAYDGDFRNGKFWNNEPDVLIANCIKLDDNSRIGDEDCFVFINKRYLLQPKRMQLQALVFEQSLKSDGSEFDRKDFPIRYFDFQERRTADYLAWWNATPDFIDLWTTPSKDWDWD